MIHIGDRTFFEERRQLQLARLFTSLRRRLADLGTYYETVSHGRTSDNKDLPDFVKGEAHPRFFPYPRSFTSSSQTMRFEYTDSLNSNGADVTFIARLESVIGSAKNVVVKFVDRYGLAAHKTLAQLGMAPHLYYFGDINGGKDTQTEHEEILTHGLYDGPLKMVVMEHIDGKEFDDVYPAAVLEKIRNMVAKLHEQGFVHGDLRDTNAFVRKHQDRWDCQFIDYDWAGREGEVVYPIGVYSSSLVWRPERYMDGQVITTEHDRRTVDEFLRRRTKINRF